MPSPNALGTVEIDRWDANIGPGPRCIGGARATGICGRDQNEESDLIDMIYANTGAYVVSRTILTWVKNRRQGVLLLGAVYLVTYQPRETRDRQGGSTFEFVTTGIADATGSQKRPRVNRRFKFTAAGHTPNLIEWLASDAVGSPPALRADAAVFTTCGYCRGPFEVYIEAGSAPQARRFGGDYPLWRTARTSVPSFALMPTCHRHGDGSYAYPRRHRRLFIPIIFGHLVPQTSFNVGWIFLAVMSTAFALVGLGGRDPVTASRSINIDVPVPSG